MTHWVRISEDYMRLIINQVITISLLYLLLLLLYLILLFLLLLLLTPYFLSSSPSSFSSSSHSSSSSSSSPSSSSSLFTDFSHLPVLLIALRQVYQWFGLGLQLGVPYYILKVIEREQRERVEDSKREMLVAWLKGQGGEPTKDYLVTALRSIWYKMADQTWPVSSVVVSHYISPDTSIVTVPLSPAMSLTPIIIGSPPPPLLSLPVIPHWSHTTQGTTAIKQSILFNLVLKFSIFLVYNYIYIYIIFLYG